MSALGCRIRHSVFLSAALALFLARPAFAQSDACGLAPIDSTPARWSAPLDRVITTPSASLALRDALTRVSTIAKLRLSYSAELVPLDRQVCLAANRTPLGRVFATLLGGTNVVAVPVGSDQIVLTPRTASTQHPAEPEMASSMSVLDKMVVTESALSNSQRQTTTSSNVLDGRLLSRQNANTLSSVLDGYVPGVWSWAQSPASVLGSYASIRGASSFGLSYPKIYIDGIEVANPLLVTRFAADAIDHVEVIRGPQGSALYGADAISGVVNIVTRHEGAGADGQHAMLRTSAGLVQSDFAHGVIAQSHSLALVTGTSTRSADLHVSANTVGDFIPNGYSRDLLATGSARVIRDRSTFSATGRFFTQEAGGATSPLLRQALADSSPMFPRGNMAPQSVREYTLATTSTFAPNNRWTHTLVAGIDGYQLANVQASLAPITTVTDSALRAAQGGAARATLRATSAVRFGGESPTRATLSFSLEHGIYAGQSDDLEMMTIGRGGFPHPQLGGVGIWQSNTGLTTQATAALANTWFATGGVRVERDSRLPGNKLAALPMIGLAAVRDFDGFTVKLRGAYGEGIRPPATFGHSVLGQNVYTSSMQQALGAEKQAGTEAGLDVFFRDAFSVHVTRFDQKASGLIQQVPLAADNSDPLSRRVRYDLENVGEIANHGWEMETAARLARLTVSGTLSMVDSRVVQLANGYTGDLLTGDRMLQVPARTAALNLSYTGRRWFATIGGSRAFDWINYDELRLARAYLSGSEPARDLGPELRSYWRRYNGGLRMHASASRDFRDMLTFEVSCDNLLNYQQNEPDNITVVPGRTIMTGIRVRF